MERRIVNAFQSKLPRELVKTGTHVVDSVSGNESETVRYRRNRSQAEEVKSFIRIEFARGFYGVTLLESSLFTPKGLQVFFRPVNLEPWVSW